MTKMKKISWVLFSIVFLPSLVFAYAVCSQGINATELAYGAPPGSISAYATKIIETFRMREQWPRYNVWQRLCVGAETAFSEADTGFTVTFTQTDVPLQQVPSVLTLANGVRVDPPTGEDEPKPGEEEEPKKRFRKNEWIDEGASSDSPPIINISKSFITELCNEGQKKYNCSNYGNNKFCTATSSCSNNFTTKTEKISNIPSTYVARNGQTAHVIPFGGLRTEAFGGVQFFRAIDVALDCKVSCNGPLEPRNPAAKVYSLTLHKETENGKEFFYIDLDEAANKCPKDADIYVGCYNNTNAYFFYVDKIFFPDTMDAVEANWLIRVYPKNDTKDEPKLIFQLPLVAASGNAPTADFEYKIGSVTGEEILVTFTPNTSDTDGQVTALTWSFGDGQKVAQQQVGEITHGFKPGYYTVSLTAYDNDGLKAKKIRTIKVEK